MPLPGGPVGFACWALAGLKGARATPRDVGVNQPLHPKPWVIEPNPYTLNPKPWIMGPDPYTLNPKPWIVEPNPYTLNP